jgi:integrase
MATLSTETYRRKDGTTSTTYRVLIGGGKRQRQTIRLGDVSERIANEAKARIEALETAKLTGTSVDRTTAAWVSAISDAIHEKLARVGLVEPREPETPKQTGAALGEIVERYIKSRSKLKPNTLRNYETTKRLLVEHFTKERLVQSIHAGHAKDYREWLVGKYAPATVAREIKRARQFFEYARDCRAIEVNPFAKVRAGSQKNTKRKAFVGRDVIEKVLEACPDNDWRLVVVLARYAGLRIPSELERLTWADVDWHGRRLTIRVPKKEHLDGHETRLVPIFPEIEPYLRQAFDETPEGGTYVLPRRFHSEGYVYAGVLRAVERASVPAWPKLLVNLRASRETELLLEHPEHVVHAWIGHSKEVADAHYAMVTDADFDRATATLPPATPAASGGRTAPGEQSASDSPIYPAQNPAQSGADLERQEPADLEKEPVSLAFAGDTGSLVPPRGVEQTQWSPKETGGNIDGDTICETSSQPERCHGLGDPAAVLSELPNCVRNQLAGLSPEMIAEITRILAAAAAPKGAW